MNERALTIQFGAEDFDRLGAEFAVFKGEIQEAARRAVKNTTDRVRDDSISEFVRVSGLRVSQIRGRLFLRYRYASGYGRVWWGLNPISLSKLNPRRTAGGVKAGPVFVPGGFMPGGRFGNTVFSRVGKKATPIQKESFKIADLGEEVIRDTVEPTIQTIFMEEFRDELFGAISGETRSKRRRMKRFSR